MTDLGREAFDITRQVTRCASIPALSELLQRSIKPLGLTASASGMLTGIKALGPDPLHFANWPSGWTELYVAERFMERDPLPRWALQSGAPASWTAIGRKLSKNDPGHAVIAAGAIWGFTEGMAVPVRAPSGDLGLVTMGGDRGPLSHDEITFLHIIGSTTLLRAELLTEPEIDDVELMNFTSREQQCIVLMQEGMTDSEIAKRFGLKPETVRFHLDNARAKIGARNRAQLSALASGVALLKGRRTD